MKFPCTSPGQRLASVLLVLATAGALRAQRSPVRPANDQVAKIEEELERKQRQFAESESRLQRLQELRMRLAFGLSVEAERYFTLDEAERALLRDGGNERFVTEEAEVQRLSLQVSALTQQYDQTIEARRNRGTSGAADETAPVPGPERSRTQRIDVPRFDAAGTANPGSAVPLAGSTSPSNATSAPPQIRIPQESSLVTTSRPSTIENPADLEPTEPTRVIVGSARRGDVGRVLLRAGEQALLDAERASDETLAQAHRERAVELLSSAKRELEPLTKPADAAFIDLFHLARCEEKLGNLAAADSLYAQIISRDIHVGADGKEAYGRWGRTAQASKSVLRWVIDTGNWRPIVEIDSIQWTDR